MVSSCFVTKNKNGLGWLAEVVEVTIGRVTKSLLQPILAVQKVVVVLLVRVFASNNARELNAVG